MAQLFGPVRGGLGISVVFVGGLLAATTGIVGATVVAMGLISLPAMLRNNYSHPLATGTIAASGTLGQIIPPSIVLIILADQLGSATDQAGTARKLLYKVDDRRIDHAVELRRHLHQRRRNVPRRAGAGAAAGRGLYRLSSSSSRRCGPRSRRPFTTRANTICALPPGCSPGADAAAGADLPGARLDHPRHRDRQPGRRHRRDRRADHGRLPALSRTSRAPIGRPSSPSPRWRSSFSGRSFTPSTSRSLRPAPTIPGSRSRPSAWSACSRRWSGAGYGRSRSTTRCRASWWRRPRPRRWSSSS